MVEFGLKLQDNKVAEWSDHYIDYEKLKVVLKKGKHAAAKIAGIRKKYPELVRNANGSENLPPVAERKDGGVEESLIDGDEKGEYGSTDLKRSSSFNALMGAVGGYFGKSSEAHLRQATEESEYLRESFTRLTYLELDKVNSFYRTNLSEMEERLEVLVDSVVNDSDSGDTSSPVGKSKSLMEKVKDATPILKSMQMKETDSIKRSISDKYRMTKLLFNFAIMNYTGFVKIVKKFDKTFPDSKGQFKDVFKKDSAMSDGTKAEVLSERMERMYAQWFCAGDLSEARAHMLPKKADGLEMDWGQLRLGYRMGMCTVLALWVCWDCIWGLFRDGNSTIGGRTAFPVFRACGGLLLLHWFWGCSVFIWNRFRINYIFLFDFDPRIVSTPIMIFNDVVDESLIFFSTMLLYYKSGAHDIPEIVPPGCYALLLVLYTIKKLVFPWKVRGPMWRTIGMVISTPISPTTFFASYVADVFTSMVKVFQDILWTLCFIGSGDFLLPEEMITNNSHAWQNSFWYKRAAIPIICLLPLWFRFNQCLRRYLDTKKRWPNLANAFKYGLSQTVTLFGTFHPLYMLHNHDKSTLTALQYQSSVGIFQIFWMGLFISSSLYSFTWDIYMDWGLGLPQFAGLGPRLMFPDKMYYYAVIGVDLVLRFMWVLTLVPPQSGARFELPNYMTAVTMALELFRRTIWGFFRLENEHRSNTQGYRRVNFVPLHFSTGHSHKYKKVEDKVGWNVLAEVGAIGAAVIAVSIASVVIAQRASQGDGQS